MEETPKKIKNENYITIQGWMVNELNLKGNELLIYAIIFGFSQTNGQVFNGSLQYLANWTNTTKQGVAKTLKLLVEKKYIIKNDKYINGVKFCEYYANDKVITELEKCKESVNTQKVDGIQQSCIGMQQSCINNIQDNIKENNKNNNILNSFNIHNEEDILDSSNILYELFLLKENQKKLEKENEELKKKPKTKSKEFVPPTLEEVKQYCLERNNKLDYKYFYDYFTEGDWKDSNGNQVKNWKQKIITWEKNKMNKQEEHKPSQGIVYEQLN